MSSSSAPTGDNGPAKGSAEPDLEDGTAYRQVRPYKLPSRNSKTVLSTVKKGPDDRDRTSHKRDDSSIPARLAQLRMAQPGVDA